MCFNQDHWQLPQTSNQYTPGTISYVKNIYYSPYNTPLESTRAEWSRRAVNISQSEHLIFVYVNMKSGGRGSSRLHSKCFRKIFIYFK